MTPEQEEAARLNYPFKQTLDLKVAMAQALAAHLLEMKLVGAQVPHLEEVFEEWARYADDQVTPCACVLPGEPLVYNNGGGFGSTLIEETWLPRGVASFGLYKKAEAEANFDVIFRARTNFERSCIVAAVENNFSATRLMMNQKRGRFVGVYLKMPAYWNREVRFVLVKSQPMDDTESAARGVSEVVVTFRGQAPFVELGPVYPMKVRVRQTIT